MYRYLYFTDCVLRFCLCMHNVPLLGGFAGNVRSGLVGASFYCAIEAIFHSVIGFVMSMIVC